ncbi:pectate lyase family protein [Halomontanus rarus]|uniref:pectate lyase family protein n=1 Tax=Halomontanus rarus TaxID=3034020 RepID=UPI0023E7BDEE|nr:hypothetical protein [Halovivax sp. TS33]
MIPRRTLLRSLGVGASASGLTVLSGSTAATGQPSRGASSVSHFDFSDGFADPAPWLDDDTPVYRVTEPTRDALESALHAEGERLVVFETSGTIDLEEEHLEVPNDKCYVAGQTAPSPGITLVRGGLYVSADDCVVQHLRVRPGDAGNESDWEPDAINTGDGTENNVIDHCTASWGIDECLSVGYNTENTTVSNCLIAEALLFSTHSKGAHGYGSLIGDGAQNVALMGNVWAHTSDRNPRLKADTESVVLNNIVYNYFKAIHMDPSTIASIVGNGFIGQEPVDPPAINNGQAYVADNYAEGTDNPVVADTVTQLEEPPLWPAGVDPLPSEQVEAHNLANAGARPADRTAHDERVIASVRERTEHGDEPVESYIDSQTEVGGYPTLPVNTHELNVPNGGIRQWLRSWSRRVETPQSR